MNKASGDLSPENFAYLCKTIYEHSGIVLDESKTYLIESRLGPVARGEGVETLDSLCKLLRTVSTKSLRTKVVEAMTTNETLFFRDLRPFEALRDQILPELTASSPKGTVRVWSAAASSGQEAYSLAMLWKELNVSGWDLKIVGTDISGEMLGRCRQGRYRQLEVNRGLPARYLVKYFDPVETDWVVKPELRRMIEWKQFNLLDDMSALGVFDIVFCRNVLIYFDQETKADILRRLRERLREGGYLFLGLSETTLNIDSAYERTTFGPAVVYRTPINCVRSETADGRQL
jgi:chemotaxis protein methyltransferase CheR